MIKNGSLVFVPETEEFSTVIAQSDKEMSMVQPIGSQAGMWKREEDLVLIFKDLPQGAPVADIIRFNLTTVAVKIAGFLYRKILAQKEENKKENAELRQQIKDLQEKIGGINQGLMQTQGQLREHANSLHSKTFGDTSV